VRAPFSEVFIFAFAVVFCSGDGWKRVDAPQEAPRRASRPADDRALPPPGHARCEWNPIMMQACQNGRGRPRIIRRNAERPRTITRGSIHAREYHFICRRPPLPSAPSPPLPTRLAWLQAAADPQRSANASRVAWLVAAAGLGNSRANRDLLVQLRVNNW